MPSTKLLDLVERVSNVLHCNLCFEISSNNKMVNCINSHFVCEMCFIHLLADAVIRQIIAQCPFCRVELNWADRCYNETVSNLIKDLPRKCHYCGELMTVTELEEHSKFRCPLKNTNCKNFKFGCEWLEPCSQLQDHDKICQFVRNDRDSVHADAINNYGTLVLNDVIKHNLYSTAVLVSEHDIRLGPLSVQPNGFLGFADAKFRAFRCKWSLRVQFYLRMLTFENNSLDRHFTYRLKLRGTPSEEELNVRYYVTASDEEDDEIKLDPKVHFNSFKLEFQKSLYQSLCLVDHHEANRLLAKKYANIKLHMFLSADPKGSAA